MQTESINVSTLCVPCDNRCRYCLLSWDGKLPGADYHRSQDYALRFYNWIQKNRPELSFQFYFGYSMEHPQLLDAIDFAAGIGSAPGSFLQFDGMKFRSEAQINSLLKSLRDHGIQTIDLTFYGTEKYHDHFAARQGDFQYMLSILACANRVGIDVKVGIPVTRENADQLEELFSLFGNYPLSRLYLFIPHGEGRGESLEPVRLTLKEYESLLPKIQQHLNRNIFRTEAEWLYPGAWQEPERRMLGLTLTKENMAQFETMPFPETIGYLEDLDDAYYSALPAFSELAHRYGDPQGCKLYSKKDLFMNYQRRYIRDQGLDLYDMNDERHCFSRRY